MRASRSRSFVTRTISPIGRRRKQMRLEAQQARASSRLARPPQALASARIYSAALAHKPRPIGRCCLAALARPPPAPRRRRRQAYSGRRRRPPLPSLASLGAQPHPPPPPLLDSVDSELSRPHRFVKNIFLFFKYILF